MNAFDLELPVRYARPNARTIRYQISKIEKKFRNAKATPLTPWKRISRPKGGMICSGDVIGSPFDRITTYGAMYCSKGIRLQAARSEKTSRKRGRTSMIEYVTLIRRANRARKPITKTG